MVIKCAKCGIDVETKFSGTKYCAMCSKEMERKRHREQSRKRREKIREAKGIVRKYEKEVGVFPTGFCIKCGIKIEGRGRTALYCHTCEKERSKERKRRYREKEREMNASSLEQIQKEIHKDEKSSNDTNLAEKAMIKPPRVNHRLSFEQLCELRGASLGTISKVAKENGMTYGWLVVEIP